MRRRASPACSLGPVAASCLPQNGELAASIQLRLRAPCVQNRLPTDDDHSTLSSYHVNNISQHTLCLGKVLYFLSSEMGEVIH